jgi:hypothetical protein
MLRNSTKATIIMMRRLKPSFRSLLLGTQCTTNPRPIDRMNRRGALLPVGLRGSVDTFGVRSRVKSERLREFR